MRTPFNNLGLLLAACFVGSLAFSGDFNITNVVVSSPFQVDPTSTQPSFVAFFFADQDTASLDPVNCAASWAVGLSPPNSYQESCQNETFAFLITSWHGVQNFSISLRHTYIDHK
ncbi:hypothetical protein B0A52_01113 [Exophiala mesophila]|uniref:Uncharacterized protein n=1 Tax=Exophiala mesophila TaxID=212818 RepID=A0A438NGK4_EXOME|nr:hypothetical protein B0A52_01113 [Exophiala mesophila]